MPGEPGTVADLEVVETGLDEVTLRWTGVDDGAGYPARYALRRGSPAISWGATAGTQEITVGGTPGAGVTHRVSGLDASTRYEFQAIAFRGTLEQDAVFGELSNVAAATTQAATSEPGPVELVFEDDWSAGFGRWDDRNTPGQHSIVADPTGSGRGNVLRVNFASADDAGWLAKWVTPPTSGELHVRTHFYLAAGWGSSDNVKLTNIAGNRSDELWSSFGKAGVIPNGSDFFQSMTAMGSGGVSNRRVLLYTYHPDQGQNWGDEDVGTVVPSVGAWHQLDHYVRINDVGQANGVVRAWIDGELVYEKTNITFRTSGILDLNMVMLSFNGGGLTGNTLYYDDVEVYDGDPGDVGSATPPPPPPPPPGGIGNAPDIMDVDHGEDGLGSWSETRGNITLVPDPTGVWGGMVADHYFRISASQVHLDDHQYQALDGVRQRGTYAAMDFVFGSPASGSEDMQRKLIYFKGDRAYGSVSVWSVVLKTNGTSLYFSGDDGGSGYSTPVSARSELEFGHPYRVELYVYVNDEGASNGIIRAWLTDLETGQRQLVEDRTNFRVTRHTGGNYRGSTDRVEIGHQLDNGSYEGTAGNEHRYVKRKMISSKEIGTYGLGS